MSNGDYSLTISHEAKKFEFTDSEHVTCISRETMEKTGMVLGKGSYGNVELVKHTQTGERFALKAIPKEPGLTKLVERETEIHRALKHSSIIQLVSSSEDASFIYIFLEYAPNGTLFHHIRRARSLSETESKRIFAQLSEGVAYLHTRNIIHRDLKPENVLMDAAMNVKICDFGYCVQDDAPRQTFCGTFDFMAPEMIQQNGHSFEVDLWALGAILYEMLHGFAPFQPFQQKSRHICQGKFLIQKDISPDATDLIKKLLSVDPKERINIADVKKHPWLSSVLRTEDNIKKKEQKIYEKLDKMFSVTKGIAETTSHTSKSSFQSQVSVFNDPAAGIFRQKTDIIQSRSLRNPIIKQDTAQSLSEENLLDKRIEELANLRRQIEGNMLQFKKPLKKPASFWEKLFGCGAA